MILNTGAHVKEDNILLDNVNNTLKRIYEINKNMNIIWRNTHFAHPDCFNHFQDDPLLEYPDLHKLGTYNSNYYWDKFASQNNLIEQLLNNYYPKVLYVNIHNSSALRIDSHVLEGDDCLHYCLSGPMDNWLLLLYNAMLKATEQFHDQKKIDNNYKKENYNYSYDFSSLLDDHTIVKGISNKKYGIDYVVINKTKHFIPSWRINNNNNYKILNEDEIESIPIGRPLYNDEPF